MGDVGLVLGVFDQYIEHGAEFLADEPVDVPAKFGTGKRALRWSPGASGGDADSCLALVVYGHRHGRELAAMAAALGGLDVVVFTGEVGEHQPTVRAAAVDGLGFLGLAVDPGRNASASSDADISVAGCPTRTIVVSSREDLEIARQVRNTFA